MSASDSERSITRRSDPYLRTLLIHGAVSAAGPLHAWALAVAERRGASKAAASPTNQFARWLWAMTRDGTSFDGNHVSVAPATHSPDPPATDRARPLDHGRTNTTMASGTVRMEAIDSRAGMERAACVDAAIAAATV